MTRKTRKNFRITKRCKYLEEVVHTYLEDYDEPTDWLMKICSLTSERIWYYIILMTGFYSMQTALKDAIVATRYTRHKKTSEFFYASDVCWLLDTSLRLLQHRLENGHFKKMDLTLMSINILSIFPMECILEASIQKDNDMYQLNRVLKIVHVCYLFNKINKTIRCSVFIKCVQALYLLIYLVLLNTFIFTFYTCYLSIGLCANIEEPNVFLLYYISVLCDSMMWGYGKHKLETVVQKSIMVLTRIWIYVFIYCLYMAFITYIFFVSAVHKNNFSYKYMAIKKYLVYLRLDQQMLNKVDLFFYKKWSICKGYAGYMAETKIEYPFDQFEDILPESYKSEIQMDVFLSAFRHSKLLKSIDISFLRDLTCVMKQQVYINGQYVFHKDELKDKMVYVFSGIVQIISEEDGDTPLISLSDGSCIGESSLILSYNSTINVRCLTTCVLQVLEKKYFLEIARKFPAQYRKLYDRIYKRYKTANELNDIKLLVNFKDDDLLRQCLSTMWINFTLHKIMGEKDFESAKKHAVQNIYTQDKINHTTFQSLLFSANYLCLYALAERARIDSDTLFIKTKFPYMLKPNTGLVLFWELLICMQALLAGIYIPYLTLVYKKRTAAFYSSIYGYTTTWLLDLVVQCRTAIQLKHSMVTNMGNIIAIKLQRPMFILDIISCIPFELCPTIFWDLDADTLYIPRILKLARVFNLLNHWQNRYNSNLIVVRITSVTFIMFYISYFLACLYFSVHCLGTCDIMELYKLIFYATQIVTGVSLWVPGYATLKSYMFMDSVNCIFMCVAFIVIYGYIFSGFAFSELYMTTMRAKTSQVLIAAKSISAALNNRLEVLVRTDAIISNGLNFYNVGYMCRCLPRPLVGHMFHHHYSDWLVDLPIFSGLPKYVILDILRNGGYVYTVGPTVTIFHTGDIMKEVMILAAGCCQRLNGVSMELEVLRTKLAFNDLEIVLNLPMRSTVFTTSHCELIRIDYTTMRRVLFKYTHGVEFTSSNLREKILKHRLHSSHISRFAKSVLDVSNGSFVFHKNDENFRKVFRTAKFQILCRLLMHVTFLPQGRFFMIWENFRCLFAVLSSIIYPTTMVIFLPRSHPITTLLWLLDITAVIDIYVRMHICYFDERGILITHPLLTAFNYLSKSFLIDLIGVFPTHLIVTMNKYIFLTLNHTFQLHRYYGLIRFKYTNAVETISKMYIFAVVPIFIVILNILSSLYVSINCFVDLTNPNYLTVPMNCSETSIFRMNKLKAKMTPFGIHFYSFYLFMGSISTIGFQGYTIANNYTMLFICVICIIGFYWNTILSAFVFRHYMFENVNLIYWDECKRRLNKIMLTSSVKPALIEYIDTYLKSCAVLLKYSLHDTLKTFAVTLRRDYLFQRYGKSLLSNCLIEATDFTSFIRNMLIDSKYNIIIEDGYVYSRNDILDETYFVYSGIVELIAPDGFILCSLKPGSIIGNLCCVTYNRMYGSIVARGIVELISVKTSKFYKVLQYFPSTKREFERLKKIHSNHVPGYSNFEYIISMNVKSKYVLSHHSKLNYAVAMMLLFFGTYVPQIVYLYQIAISEFSLAFLFVNIFCDLLYAASLALNFFLPLNTENGIIMDLITIRSYWIRKTTFWFSIFAGIPFYILAYSYNKVQSNFFLAFMCLRFNVMLRLVYSIPTFHSINQRWNIRIIIVKIISMMFLTLLIMFIWTAALLIPAHYTDLNMSEHVDARTLHEKSSNYKFYLFLKWFDVITGAFTQNSQILYYPVDTPYVVLIICLSAFWMMFVAIFIAVMIALMLSARHIMWIYISSLDKLNGYFENCQMSANLHERVEEYADLVWEHSHGTKQAKALDMLPYYLKECIMGYMFGYLFGENSAFALCHEDFRRQIIPMLKFEIYNVGDFIVRRGSIDGTMYWVHSGTVVSLSETSDYSDNHIRIYCKGNSFGMAQGVYHLTSHLFSYKATSVCMIASLVKNDWEHLMAFFPASRRIIHNEANHRAERERSIYNSIYKNINF